MEIKTQQELESSGYRALFEYIQKEGVLKAWHFVHDINKISLQKNIVLKNAIFSGRNDLLALVKRNLDIIKYLRAHEADFKAFSFTSENVFKAVNTLAENNALLELYLDNAKALEALKIYRVEFKSFPAWYSRKCEIYRNGDGEIINISKCYTDARIESIEPEKEVDPLFNYSEIEFAIDNSSETQTFILNASNNEEMWQYRGIEIADFGFDASKLPKEDELQSYEIPKYLNRK